MKPFIFIIFIGFLVPKLHAQVDTISTKNIVYAEANGKQLHVDIYKIKNQEKPKLIVWVHGGAWMGGTKENPPLNLLGYGYALASVEFRLSTEQIFPAQIHDLKAAIRYLRANAKLYGFDADKIVIWGSSSGGHLAALVATTNHNKQLEGSLGNFTNTGSSVQGCIDFFGPTNLLSILYQSTPHGLDVRVPALKNLLGKPVEQDSALAKLASPVFQVDSTDPPMMIVHGEQDNQVPINQSIELYTKFKENNLKCKIEFVPNAGHSSPLIFTKKIMDLIDNFLKENIYK